MRTIKFLCLSAVVFTLTVPLVHAGWPSTGFTYQGKLFIGDVPANGLYDLQFTNYDAATGGSALGGFNTNALPVTNGMFAVTLDFGAVFDGTPRWLEISERTNGAAAFATLAPRQLLAAAPYATYAASAGTATSAASAAYATNAGTAGAVAGLTILQNASGAPNVIEGSQVNWVASGVVGATIGGGGAYDYHGDTFINSVSADFGTIGGGEVNRIQSNANEATIGGGYLNTIQSDAGGATVGGGEGNTIQANANDATISGGGGNTIQTNAQYATIGGGYQNTIQTNAQYATIGGGYQNTIQTNGYTSTINGGWQNAIQTHAEFATIGGGDNNVIQTNSYGATIGGGEQNSIQAVAQDETIGGGIGNTIQFNDGNSTIGGGVGNTIDTETWGATIGGGGPNTIQTLAFGATIGGGYNNTNLANGRFATIPGGDQNSATNYAFAAGNQAQAIHTGAFVWADSTAAFFSSTANDQFAVRASGGVFFQLGGANATVQADDTSGFKDAKQLVIQGNTDSSRQLELGYKTADSANYGTIQAVDQNTSFRPLVLQPSGGNVGIGTTTPGNLLVVGTGGAYCNGTSWVNGSDRNSKEAFTAINPRAVLEKVSALPITEWKYKVEADGTEHLGPMAQDFHAAFGLNGADDKHIATVDEEGVALAAIQGLNQKLEETRADNAALRADNADLRARLEKLERLLKPSN